MSELNELKTVLSVSGIAGYRAAFQAASEAVGLLGLHQVAMQAITDKLNASQIRQEAQTAVLAESRKQQASSYLAEIYLHESNAAAMASEQAATLQLVQARETLRLEQLLSLQSSIPPEDTELMAETNAAIAAQYGTMATRGGRIRMLQGESDSHSNAANAVAKRVENPTVDDIYAAQKIPALEKVAAANEALVASNAQVAASEQEVAVAASAVSAARSLANSAVAEETALNEEAIASRTHVAVVVAAIDRDLAEKEAERAAAALAADAAIAKADLEVYYARLRLNEATSSSAVTDDIIGESIARVAAEEAVVAAVQTRERVEVEAAAVQAANDLRIQKGVALRIEEQMKLLVIEGALEAQQERVLAADAVYVEMTESLAASEGRLAAALSARTEAEQEASVAGQELAAVDVEVAVAEDAVLSPLILIQVALVAVVAAIAIAGAALAGYIAYLKMTITAEMDLSDSLVNLQMRIRATSDEMHDMENTALSTQMEDMAITGAKSAAIMAELAAANYNVADAQKVAISVGQLQTATGWSQEDSTRAMVLALRVWKLGADDASYAADQLTGAWVNTRLTGAETAKILGAAGNMAKMMGWSMGETVTVLGKLKDTMGNVEGASRPLLMLMQKLYAPTKEVAAKFKEFGLDAADFPQHSKSLIDFISWLQTAKGPVMELVAALGIHGGKLGIALKNLDVDQMRRLAAEWDKAGIAAEYATKRAESLKFMVEQIKAVFFNLKAVLGELYVSKIGEWFESIKVTLEALVQVVQEYQEAQKKAMEAAGEAVRSHADEVKDDANTIINWIVGIISTVWILKDLLITPWDIPADFSKLEKFLKMAEDLKAKIEGTVDATEHATGDKKASDGASDADNAELKRLRDKENELKEKRRRVRESAFGTQGDDMNLTIDIASVDADIARLESKMTKVKSAREAAQAAVANDPSNNPDASAAEDNTAAWENYIKELEFAKKLKLAMESDDAKRYQIESDFAKAKTNALKQEEDAQAALYWSYKKAADAHAGDENDEASKEYLAAADKAATAWKKIDDERRNTEIDTIDKQRQAQESASKASEEERKKALEWMDKMYKKSDDLHKVVQMVIGGQISELVKQQIAGLTGAGLGKEGRLKSVGMVSDRTIYLKLEPTGPLNPSQMSQISNFVVGAIEDAGTRLPIGV